MKITFEYEWQAIEFMADCKRAGVVVIRSGETVQFPAYKLETIAQILLQACKEI